MVALISHDHNPRRTPRPFLGQIQRLPSIPRLMPVDVRVFRVLIKGTALQHRSLENATIKSQLQFKKAEAWHAPGNLA